MEIKENITNKKVIFADKLNVGESFKYKNHIYLKAAVSLTPIFFMYSDIVYVDLTDNKIYPSYEFKGVQIEPVQAYVRIESVES